MCLLPFTLSFTNYYITKIKREGEEGREGEGKGREEKGREGKGGEGEGEEGRGEGIYLSL